MPESHEIAHPIGHEQLQPHPPMSALAIVALACAVQLPPLGVVLGIVAVIRLRRTGQRGLVVAASSIAVGVIFTIGVAVFIVFLSMVPFLLQYWVYSGA
jgi:hypothetical protein